MRTDASDVGQGVIGAIKRRDFLKAGLGLAAIPGVALGGGTAGLKIGIISDNHMHLSRRKNWPVERLRLVLSYLDAAGVDVVVNAGDLADTGQVSELRKVAEIWDECFPGGRGCDGRPVERFFVTGNHDMLQTSASLPEEIRQARLKEAFVKDPAHYWQEIFGEPWEPIRVRTIKGYDFVGVHFGHEAEIERWFAANGDRLKGKRPFFFVQHFHPKGTCFQDGAAADKGVSTRMLADYPNCFAISGHSHRPLADERAIWQGTFTSMGAGALASMLWPHRCENSYLPVSMRSKINLHMPVHSSRGAYNGSVMTVSEDALRIERRDFAAGEKVGPDWILPLPLATNPAKPFVFAEKGSAPYFGKRAKVKVEEVEGKDRQERPETQIVVTVPPAWAPNPYSRTIFYNAKAIDAETGKPLAKKRAMADGFHLPFERTRKHPGKVVFPKSAFKSGAKVKFEVSAENAAGMKCAPLVSGPHEITSGKGSGS